MGIIVNLDVMMAKRKMSLTELAGKVDQEFPLPAADAHQIRPFPLHLARQLLHGEVLRGQHQAVPAVLPLDVPQLPGQHHLALVDDGDVIAEFLHIAHLVAGEYHDPIVRDELADHVLQYLGVNRIHSS